MREARRILILEAIRDLLDSKTWRPDSEDLEFALGYVASHVRQSSGTSPDEYERGFIVMQLLDRCPKD
jgi:hypothetical protein